MRRITIILMFLSILGSSAMAEKLVVGVAGSPPFVTEDYPLDGLSIRVWKEMALKQGWEYDLIRYPSVAELLQSVANDEVDVAVGPISITSQRANLVEFTQPYYRADLGILSHSDKRTTWEMVKPFVSQNFIYALGILLTILTVVGGLVCLAERKANPEQFPPGLAGLGNGMWFAIVTMTTVGYGDRSPVTPLGRLLTSVWMLIATISFSTLTAGIATALTLSTLTRSDISKPGQLADHRVAVIAGSTGSEAAQQFGAQLVLTNSLPEAIQLIKTGRAEAVVFDYPALRYYLQHEKEVHGLKLAETHFNKQDYGFAVRLHSHMAHEMDVELLGMLESGRLEEIEEQWLAEGSSGS